ncbi:MAG: DUF1877 family protein [Myxococcales bacterium]|nr:DUF1877 family protein [Myxococcales bacterium]
MIGELRQVPAGLVTALEDRARRREVAKVVMASEGLSLDRAWSGLGFLLGGLCAEDPMGGQVLHGVDSGYGPPELLVPEDVQACARELAALDEPTLREAYDPSAMARENVYPNIWDRPGERERNLAWLIETFRSVRDFYQDAARRGHGVLYFVS